MFQEKLNAFLYKWRYVAIGISFIFIAYVNIYIWFFVPYSDFGYTLHEDIYWLIDEVESGSPAENLLAVGDIIVAVDGEPAIVGQRLYSVPKQSTYTLTIERGGETLEVEIPFSARPHTTAVSYRLPAGLLSFVLWLVGPLLLHFARKENQAALHLGYSFLIGGVTVIGVQGFVLSVPFAWLGSSLIYLGTACLLYMGFIPRSTPLPKVVKYALTVIFPLAILLGIAVILEALFLFPQLNSVEKSIGFSLYGWGIILQGIGLLVCFTTLFVRGITMKPSYQQQQIRILMLFIGLSTLPAALLTFIPNFLLGQLFLPFPVSISLLILFPLGYFYVIFRKGYLGLDIIFSQAIMIIAVIVAMLTFYGTFLFLLQSQFNFQSNSIVVATLTVVPTILLTGYSYKPINSAVTSVLFGSAARSMEKLPAIASQLSSKPELTTLKAIVHSLTHDFDIPQALLALRNAEGNLFPAAQVEVSDWIPMRIKDLQELSGPVVRTAAVNQEQTHQLLEMYSWIELLIPVVIREELVGVLALARPADGYFNARHIAFLSRVADMIAVGSEAIFLFETSRQLSLQLISAQEQERQRLAKNIHDNPLQTLAFVTSEIGRIARQLDEVEGTVFAEQLRRQIQYLQDTQDELRDVCAGLYPQLIEKGFKIIAQGLAREFSEKHDFTVDLRLILPDQCDGKLQAYTAVYYIIREALNNVVKHAQTNAACIEMSRQNGHLLTQVSDKGIGSVLPNLSRNDLLKAKHLGVIGMYERAELVAGTLRIEPNLPQGTKIILMVPIT